MRILAIIKDGERRHLLRKLTKKGHSVRVVNNTEKIPYNDIDVVVSLSEHTVEDAFNVSQRYNIPFYAHIDWIPPWMVFKESEYNWGYIDKLPYSKKMNFIRKYQNLAMYWSMADVKSMSANCFHELMREVVGMPDLKIYTRYPLPDIEGIDSFNKSKPDHIGVDEITCVTRFVPHKRVHHLIKALQMIEFDGVLNLIGSGEEKNLYEAIKGPLTINYVSELDKYDAIARSRLTVVIWGATVPAESLLLETPVLAYESEYLKEIYGNMIFYVKNNAISELAKGIRTLMLAKVQPVYNYNDDDKLEKLIMKAVRK